MFVWNGEEGKKMDEDIVGTTNINVFDRRIEGDRDNQKCAE